MKNIKETMTFLGLSYSKEMGKLAAVNTLILSLTALIYFLVEKEYYVFVIGFALMAGFTLFYFSRYQGKKKEFILNSEKEFIVLLSYFEVFIANHMNVYTAFTSLMDYASDYMKEMIHRFLMEMDVDKSVQPFIHFAHLFQNNVFESIMLSIYQMVDNGEDEDNLLHFTMIFSTISLSENANKISLKKQSLDSTSTFPLIGAAIVSVLLIVSVFSLMGDMINVI